MRHPFQGSFEDYSSEVADGDRKRFFDDISKAEGRYGNIEVSVNITESMDVEALPIFVSPSDARSNVRLLKWPDGRILVNYMVWYTGDKRPEVAKHEMGHTMGLVDQYDDVNNISEPRAGFEENIMGNVCCGHKFSTQDIILMERLSRSNNHISPIKIRELK